MTLPQPVNYQPAECNPRLRVAEIIAGIANPLPILADEHEHFFFATMEEVEAYLAFVDTTDFCGTVTVIQEHDVLRRDFKGGLLANFR